MQQVKKIVLDSKSFCKPSSFPNVKAQVFPLTDISNVYNADLTPNQMIRIEKQGIDSKITILYLEKSSPYFKPIIKEIRESTDSLCRGEIDDEYIKDIRHKIEGIVLVSVPSLDEDKNDTCTIAGFGLLSLLDMEEIVEGVFDDKEKVGHLEVICALENKVDYQGQTLSWGLGLLVQYFSCKVLADFYKCKKAIAYAGSPLLIDYYIKNGWTFGLWDEFSADHIVTNMKKTKEYAASLHSEGKTKNKLFSYLSKWLLKKVSSELETEESLLSKVETQDDFLSFEDKSESIAFNLAEKIVKVKAELFLVTIFLDKQKEMKFLAKKSFKLFNDFIQANIELEQRQDSESESESETVSFDEESSSSDEVTDSDIEVEFEY